jgi:hypothetical protein
MPNQPLGPTGLLAQSMTLPAGSQSMAMGGMGLRAQGMDGRKTGGSPVRLFRVSPAVLGKTTWNLDTDGPLSVLVTAANTQQTVTITPLTSGTMNVSAWGQGTASANGDYLRATFRVEAGVPYVVTAGRGPGQGGNGDGGVGTWGGGYSGIFRQSVAQANALLIAAAAGGGPQDYPGFGAGAGGYPLGAAGTGTNAPGGGTQIAGGANNGGFESINGTNGSALQGGRGSDESSGTPTHGGGGGGGGGWFGGGGGPGGGSVRGGGGGGSSYVSQSVTSFTSGYSVGVLDPRRTNSAGTNYAGLLVIF